MRRIAQKSLRVVCGHADIFDRCKLSGTSKRLECVGLRMVQDPLKVVRRMAREDSYTKEDIRQFLENFCPPEPEIDDDDIKLKKEYNSDGELYRGEIHDWSKFSETPVCEFLPPGYRTTGVIDVSDPDELSHEVEVFFRNPWVSEE